MSNTPRWLRDAAFDRADGVCEVMFPRLCSFQGTDVHHRKKRSGGGEHALDNALWVCRSCHQALEARPALSYDWGLLVHREGVPVFPPRMYRGIVDGRRVTPADLGTT